MLDPDQPPEAVVAVDDDLVRRGGARESNDGGAEQQAGAKATGVHLAPSSDRRGKARATIRVKPGKGCKH
jgi:hypothetical protein